MSTTISEATLKLLESFKSLEFSEQIDFISKAIESGSGWMISSTINSCSHSLFMKGFGSTKTLNTNLDEVYPIQKRLENISDEIADIARRGKLL